MISTVGSDSRLDTIASGDMNAGMIAAVFADVYDRKLEFGDAIRSILQGFDTRVVNLKKFAADAQTEGEKEFFQDHVQLNQKWAADLRAGKDIEYRYDLVSGVMIPGTNDRKKMTDKALTPLSFDE